MTEVKIIRTIANQLIIGKVSDLGDHYKVETPYNMIPHNDGITLFPYDKELVGKDIEHLEIYKNSSIYCTEPGHNIKTQYLQIISGIETEPKKELILG